MNKTLSITLSILLIVVPLSSITSQEQTSQQVDPCLQATIDAQNDVNGGMWWAAGCLFGIFGWGAAYIIEPTPQATRFIGKDAQYISSYTSCYKNEGQQVQQKKALNGCLIGVAFSLIAFSTNPID